MCVCVCVCACVRARADKHDTSSEVDTNKHDMYNTETYVMVSYYVNWIKHTIFTLFCILVVYYRSTVQIKTIIKSLLTISATQLRFEGFDLLQRLVLTIGNSDLKSRGSQPLPTGHNLNIYLYTVNTFVFYFKDINKEYTCIYTHMCEHTHNYIWVVLFKYRF